MGVFLNGVARFFTVLMLFFFSQGSVGASIDDDELGTWYMTSFIKQWSDSNWGFQGDIQYRSWDHGSDLEQLLLRGGITFSPTASSKLFTFGMANITSGQFGPSRKTVAENRVYQEALMPQRLGERVLLRHRFRFEQRWVEGQDFRTRFRYALSVTIPLNSTEVSKGTWYLSFYDELFVNGQRDIGNG
ncbi:MAG: DUF2490 domain-containing protein, partial [Luminiphilus sp.]